MDVIKIYIKPKNTTCMYDYTIVSAKFIKDIFLEHYVVLSKS